MDTNQILDSHAHTNGLGVTSDIRANLAEAARWGKFLAIVGFISVGFIVLAAIFMGVFMSSMMGEMSEIYPVPVPGFLFSLIYLALAALYFFPCLYLYRFATRMQTALAADSGMDFSESFKNLKALYRFMGIFTAIILGFYALFFVFGLLGGLLAAF